MKIFNRDSKAGRSSQRGASTIEYAIICLCLVLATAATTPSLTRKMNRKFFVASYIIGGGSIDSILNETTEDPGELDLPD